MTSPHDEQALLLYAHGELSGLERARMELHLRSCPTCRLRWQQFRTDAGMIRQALQAPLAPTAASWLAAAISERVRETAQEQPGPAQLARRGYRSRGLVMVTAALVLLLLLAATAAVFRGGVLGRRGAAGQNPADCGKPPAPQTTPSATDILGGGGGTTPGK